MQLCFNATKFGLGLKEAIELAASKNLPAFEYAFEPFAEETEMGQSEKDYLQDVQKLSKEKNIEIVLKLNYLLNVYDERSAEQFKQMFDRLQLVAKTIGCKKILFSLKASAENDFKDKVREILMPIIESMNKEGLRLLLSLSTFSDYVGKSLAAWRPLYPQEWRDLITYCPGLSLSFSPADCVWQSIDYLKVLPGIISAVDHIEANDVEVNRTMLSDSGLFGPLWWRYRVCGKGHVDWKQFIEALKLYSYSGSFSIQMDDEFIGDAYQDLDDTLDLSKTFLAPLLKY